MPTRVKDGHVHVCAGKVILIKLIKDRKRRKTGVLLMIKLVDSTVILSCVHVQYIVLCNVL